MCIRDRGDEIIHSGQGMNQILVIDRTTALYQQRQLQQSGYGLSGSMYPVSYTHLRLIDIEPDWVHLDTDENGIRMNS